MLTSILDTETALSSLSTLEFLECTAASMVLGIGCAMIYMFKHKYRKDFVVTLALLPLSVQLVIMLVNGNLGTGVAVMGAFSLVRFRSIPGTAKDIGSIFSAMAIGLATGMGCLFAAVIFLFCFGAFSMILNMTSFGEGSVGMKQLKITIPENPDYDGIFDDLFEKYTKKCELTQVRTTNMGSHFELTYCIELKEKLPGKDFLDALRCRNGNLKVICGMLDENREAI